MHLPQRTSAPHHAALFFDFADPRCLVAAVRLPRACASHRCSLLLEPVEGRRLADAVARDWTAEWPATERAAHALGFELIRPAAPFDARPLLLTCLFVRERSGQEAMLAVAERIWQEVWMRGADPADPRTALRAGAEAALPEAALRAGLADPRVARALDGSTRRAARQGVRELPSVLVDDRVYAGLAQLAAAEAHLRGEAPPGGAAPPTGQGLPDWAFSG